MLPYLRRLRDKPPGPAFQPRVHGRRLFLHTFRFRNRVCIRRQVENHADTQGILQKEAHQTASDGHNGRASRSRFLLHPGQREMGRYTGTLHYGAHSPAAESFPASGSSRNRSRCQGKQRNVSAQRTELVAVFRIHRQYPLRPVHKEIFNKSADSSGNRSRSRTRLVRDIQPFRLRTSGGRLVHD